ncbi:hypothetical protein [Halapricum hydrolyticum]|uniref:NADH-quinone oxidoreductase subunit J n=1 Tax=Halapricum hydrolyticum TaxID=2979991 RepID=A0AAE3IBA1_9EURY|nr:hypothetical protein [Halapricum hydrolyticum]MCU4717490.1 hypothetical protein [Halapricum hydrolyticum]MCU4726654.1 hypothetical protein [Halapricum hydrolyticum]
MTSTVGIAALAAMLVFAVAAVGLRDMIRVVSALALSSLALAAFLFVEGMAYAAVFEATVAGGLVSILFLLVISMTDDDHVGYVRGRTAVLAGGAGAVFLAALGLAWQGLSTITLAESTAATEPFVEWFWAAHPLDVLLVTVLVFVGVLAISRLTTPLAPPESERAPGEASEAAESGAVETEEIA